MKIKQEVLEVLSTLTFDEKVARLPEGQLDRKLYLAVAKVVKEMGGKWNRKAQGFLFTEEAAPLFDNVLNTGEVTTRREVGFFQTPSPLVQQLLEVAEVKEGDLVVEPSAGEGRIVEQLLEKGCRVCAVERDDARRSQLQKSFASNGRCSIPAVQDFLDLEIGGFQADAVVMNPPFTKCGKGDHLDHVLHALNLLGSGGTLVSVLPSSVMWRQDKRHHLFRETIAKMDSEIINLPEDAFKSEGTSVRTVILKVRKPL